MRVVNVLSSCFRRRRSGGGSSGGSGGGGGSGQWGGGVSSSSGSGGVSGGGSGQCGGSGSGSGGGSGGSSSSGSGGGQLGSGGGATVFSLSHRRVVCRQTTTPATYRQTGAWENLLPLHSLRNHHTLAPLRRRTRSHTRMTVNLSSPPPPPSHHPHLGGAPYNLPIKRFDVVLLSPTLVTWSNSASSAAPRLAGSLASLIKGSHSHRPTIVKHNYSCVYMNSYV